MCPAAGQRGSAFTLFLTSDRSSFGGIPPRRHLPWRTGPLKAVPQVVMDAHSGARRRTGIGLIWSLRRGRTGAAFAAVCVELACCLGLAFVEIDELGHVPVEEMKPQHLGRVIDAAAVGVGEGGEAHSDPVGVGELVADRFGKRAGQGRSRPAHFGQEVQHPIRATRPSLNTRSDGLYAPSG